MANPTGLDYTHQDAETNYHEFLVRASPATEELIDSLAKESGYPRGHVLLWGALLYQLAWKAKTEGKRFGVVGHDGKLEMEIHL